MGVRAPQQEDYSFQVAAQPLDHSIGEALPAPVLVGVGLVGTHRQHRVEQQHPLGSQDNPGGEHILALRVWARMGRKNSVGVGVNVVWVDCI